MLNEPKKNKTLNQIPKMIRVYARHGATHLHLGSPFQFDVPETTTIGEICNMIVQANNSAGPNYSCYKYIKVSIMADLNGRMIPNSLVIGSNHYQKEMAVLFKVDQVE